MILLNEKTAKSLKDGTILYNTRNFTLYQTTSNLSDCRSVHIKRYSDDKERNTIKCKCNKNCNKNTGLSVDVSQKAWYIIDDETTLTQLSLGMSIV